MLKKHFILELERVVEAGVTIKHSEMAEKIDTVFQNPTQISSKVPIGVSVASYLRIS